MTPLTELPAPMDLHLTAAAEALAFSKRLSAGGGLRFPWMDVDRLTGPLIPGWLVLVGARAKGGKSTFLREVFNDWIVMGKRVVYVGTEQAAQILKMLWGCLRLGFPASVAFDPHDPRNAAVLEDVVRGQKPLADRAVIVADAGLTLTGFTEWARMAYRLGADALILDHFHRLEGADWKEQGAAIRRIKNIASQSGMLILAAAQLKQGEGGPLGEYEVPGSHSWAGTSNLQRECDISLQCWRPFRPGVSGTQKREAKENLSRLPEIIQPHTMAVRLAAHRYRSADTTPTRLYVTDDRLESWSAR